MFFYLPVIRYLPRPHRLLMFLHPYVALYLPVLFFLLVALSSNGPQSSRGPILQVILYLPVVLSCSDFYCSGPSYAHVVIYIQCPSTFYNSLSTSSSLCSSDTLFPVIVYLPVVPHPPMALSFCGPLSSRAIPSTSGYPCFNGQQS